VVPIIATSGVVPAAMAVDEVLHEVGQGLALGTHRPHGQLAGGGPGGQGGLVGAAGAGVVGAAARGERGQGERGHQGDTRSGTDHGSFLLERTVRRLIGARCASRVYALRSSVMLSA